MSAQKSRAELSVWNFVDRKVKTLSGNASQVARDWSFLGGQKCRLQCQVLPYVGAVSASVRNGEWMMFENVSTFSVRPKCYAPLLLLDRLPDCLGQQVVSVSRYGKRSAIFRPHSHHIIIITVFPSIKLEHVLHETAQCACFVKSLCITFLSYLGLKLEPWTYGWQLIAAPFTMEKNHSHSARMRCLFLVSWYNQYLMDMWYPFWTVHMWGWHTPTTVMQLT